MQAQVKAFFDPATWTVSYVVFDAPGGHCALVDSVLDYDPKSGRTRTHSAERLIEFVQAHGLTVQWILETHAHADHLSAAHYLRNKLGGRIAIGAAITQVQDVFKAVFHLEPEFRPDGRQFDHLLHDNEVFRIGQLEAKALSVPGHTPTVVAKRTNVSRHHTDNTMSHTFTTYYATFQVESGDRMELEVDGSDYGMLVEGDTGKLSFQGTRYLGFERKDG